MEEIILEAKIENIPKLTDFVDEQLEKIACPMKAQIQIDVAIDEIFSNIAYYAYPERIGKVTIQLYTKDCVILKFIDEGIPFNPLEMKDPDIETGVEQRNTGGLGIFLVKKSMDTVNYEYLDEKNIFTIKKELI